MARLALTIAGAALGAAIAYFSMGTATAAGIQLGMSIGMMAGGIIGQLAFPGSGPHIYGPRVTDLQVSSSAPGMVIPLLWGTMRLGGQVIWSTGLTETTVNTTQGGKGMPSATQTTYTYSVSFASGFCQGPATTARIWGDSKIIYNKGGVSANNKGTWNAFTLYQVNDIVTWKNSAKVTLTYLCVLQNLNVPPSNSSFWSEYLIDTAGNVSKYSLPTIYPGDELQNPDPTIVANEGADVTPAYRGLAYIVWENFPLADFGNRLPNIRAEVTSNGDKSYPLTRIPWNLGLGTNKPYYVATDSTGQTAFVWEGLTNGGTDPSAGLIQRVDLSSNEVVASGSMSGIGLTMTVGTITGDQVKTFIPGTDQLPGYSGRMCVDDSGALWSSGTVGGTTIRGLFKIDPWTFKILQTVDIHLWGDSDGSDHGVCDFVSSIQSVTLADGSNYLIGIGTDLSGFSTLFVFSAGGGIVGQYYGFGTDRISQTYVPCDSAGNIYVLHEDAAFTGNWRVTKVNYLSGAVLPKGTPPLPRGPILTNAQTHSFAADVSRGTPRAMFLDDTDNSLVMMTNQGTFLKLDANSFTVLDEVGSASNPQFAVGTTFPWQQNTISFATLGYDGFQVVGPGEIVQKAFKSHIQNGVFVAPSLLSENSGASIAIVNASNFERISLVDLGNFSASGAPSGSSWPENGAGEGSMIFDTKSNALLCLAFAEVPGYPSTVTYPYALYRAYLERVSTAGVTADVIVNRVCELVGMKPGTYDASQLASISVQGYPVSSLQPGKTIMSTLGMAYFFEARESDFVLEFIPRGQASELTVPEDTLGLGADGASLTEVIGQEQDIPKTVEINYTNPQTDYQQGQQKRIRHSKTKKTLNQTSISLPLVMNAVQAAQLADKILWNAENERRTYSTNFWKAYYMLLDPCDIITIDYHGVALVTRVTESTIGQNFATAAKMTSEDSNSYVSVATGNNGGFVGQVIKDLSTTLFWLLDIPYLEDTDADATGNTGYYFVAAPSGTNGTWPAAVLYNSSDNLSFAQVDAVNAQIAYASAQNVLGAPASPFCWDFTNTLTIRMSNGEAPGSDTMLNVLNGANVAVMYPSLEIIQFTTVTDNGDGTLTLSGLLRGRRGTDDFCAGHKLGETVFFPEVQGGVKHEQISLSVLNLLRYYKGVTVGADLNSAPVSQRVTIMGRDLMPYAPYKVTGNLSGGDWTIGWFRRTRLGGAWADGIGDVVLAEDGQAYSIDILDVDNVTVKRIMNVTTNSVDYTAAMQTADFGSTQSILRVNVYQVSGQVGRGFVTNKLINVSETLPPVDNAPPMDAGELNGIIGGGFTINGS